MSNFYENNKDVVNIVAAVKSAESYSKMAQGLNSLNTSRGGAKGFGGFAFEEMHAADARLKGHTCEVVNNNGAADLILDGEPVQLKMGYKTGNPKWTDGYGSVITDRGNTRLAEKAAEAGLNVEESAVSASEAKTLANVMRKESAITGSSTAPITGTVASSHLAGKAAAGLTAKVAVPFQAGANLCDVMTGDKSVEDAVTDTVVDGAVAVGSAYLGTAALTTAATVASTVAAETAVGAAATAAATAATTAIAGTAVGGAAMAAAGSAAAVTATAIGAVAAAPFLPVAAAAVGVGCIGRALSKLF